jgi:hypothetical protein
MRTASIFRVEGWEGRRNFCPHLHGRRVRRRNRLSPSSGQDSQKMEEPDGSMFRVEKLKYGEKNCLHVEAETCLSLSLSLSLCVPLQGRYLRRQG